VLLLPLLSLNSLPAKHPRPVIMFKSKGDRPTIKTVEESVIEMEGPMSSSYTSNKNKKNKGKNKNVDEYFVC
jgi:hypothetical protein